VVFVGAGPGDPELLTIKARRLIHEADVIVHDRLVSAEILDLGRKEAKYVSVGKQGFGPSASQTDINAHLVREASQGLLVVRLKGGDPSVFGRLDEEIEALSEKGIEVSVVPGVTAAAAAAASLKVSLTRRHRNSSVTFLTAHDAHGFAEHDWQQLARSKQALAVYMGKRSAKFLQGRLLMHGLAADTPVTCIENVSLANERVMTSQLLGFAQAITEADCKGPLMILIGIQSDIGAAIADLVAQAPEFPAVSSGAL
jgi:uroporphyrin-III C-methyltransferase/precorrin-2 dehydrogenase/sirohydrochlorin ferrochelatase